MPEEEQSSSGVLRATFKMAAVQIAFCGLPPIITYAMGGHWQGMFISWYAGNCALLEALVISPRFLRWMRTQNRIVHGKDDTYSPDDPRVFPWLGDNVVLRPKITPVEKKKPKYDP